MATEGDIFPSKTCGIPLRRTSVRLRCRGWNRLLNMSEDFLEADEDEESLEEEDEDEESLDEEDEDEDEDEDDESLEDEESESLYEEDDDDDEDDESLEEEEEDEEAGEEVTKAPRLMGIAGSARAGSSLDLSLELASVSLSISRRFGRVVAETGWVPWKSASASTIESASRLKDGIKSNIVNEDVLGDDMISNVRLRDKSIIRSYKGNAIGYRWGTFSK
ncbi:hypothetical protein JR316_0004164 [Psilocybe cubensis]|uniref:Uncharacterized protein n=1 Tax=Psilocybe cubensis TaxID=181762 RepID=A0ACB8H2X8_PSICU|nr:hypothetical protein JR316_0004164 [Psilocybe cubensis]KAH9482069.1 hypothetical protein JR316_0004164 [Psilocybe cubensis]